MKRTIWIVLAILIVGAIFYVYKGEKMQKVQFVSFNEEPVEVISDLISRQYVYGERLMLCRWSLKKGAMIPKHKHPNEQITYITSGSVKVTTEGKSFIVKAGELMVLPANTYHEFVALEDTIDIDAFSPPRKDWINKTDTYLDRSKE